MELTRDLDVRKAYARDASGLELVADAIARPSSADEVAAIVRQALVERSSVTPAGGQTSMTGGSITDRGILLSVADMSAVLDVDPGARMARVQPGVRVGALNTELAPLGLRFAPDPTSEHDATVGGAIACNASGARSLRYGSTRRHVRSLRVVDGRGEIVHLRRPRLEKNTVGYHVAQDPVDWIVGSEGTLGVIVEAELALVDLPAHEFGLALPFRSEHDALAFVAAARSRGDENRADRAQCLEFFDGQALEIARDWLTAPEWMAGASSLVYLEQAVEESEGMDAALDRWLGLAELFAVDAASIAVYDGAAGLRDARRFRHAVPARMNERGSARRAYGGRKLSTDWAVPYARLAHAVDTARRTADAHGVEQSVIYGHAGNGHPHQNFIAADGDELQRITEVIDETLRMVLELGGTVAAEHGLGKLKRHWLHTQLTALQLDVMRGLKNALDPAGLFAPGNVL